MITKYKVPIDTLKDILLSKDIKPSVQRLKILEYIIDSKSHPSVDEIFGALQPLIPTLSKTTVYNTVKSLTDKGILVTIKSDPGELRYDYFDEPHSHFKCRICGELYDIYDNLENIYNIKEIDGHKVEKVSLCFEGICKKCLKKSNTIKQTIKEESMKKYICDICGYIYDPENGDPDNGVAPGTAFEKLPEDWVCPMCGAGKEDFSETE